MSTSASAVRGALNAVNEGAPSAVIEVKPLTRTIGAELFGINLSQTLSDALLADVRAALLKWKVVFFRDQNITTEQHLAFARHVLDMDAEQSAQLLRHLYAQAAIPEFQCRFRWQANSIAFWDNRSTQHYAVSEYWPDVRRMQRVTLCGDRPV